MVVPRKTEPKTRKTKPKISTNMIQITRPYRHIWHLNGNCLFYFFFLFTIFNIRYITIWTNHLNRKKNIAHPSLSSQWSAATNKKGISNEFILLKNSIQKKNTVHHIVYWSSLEFRKFFLSAFNRKKNSKKKFEIQNPYIYTIVLLYSRKVFFSSFLLCLFIYLCICMCVWLLFIHTYTVFIENSIPSIHHSHHHDFS